MTPDKLLNQQLGPYRLESILGSGGMAVVYRAGRSDGEAVALKVLFPPPGAGDEVRARFEREARTAARLRHPGIVRVLDAGQAEGYAYLAMTLVDGQSLARRLSGPNARPLDENTAADIAWQLADALYYAHSQGVVHRDVKPSNILLTPDGRALLTDFGVAQALDDPGLTRTGHTVGTPTYMAPEQASGEQPVDGRADLYSLGVVLYHMVTGRPPFQGPTPRLLHAHLFEPPPPPSSLAQVSPGLEAVILRALAKDVSQRFQTGAALAQALANLSDQTGTRLELITPPKSRSLRPRRLGWGIALMALLALGLGVWQFVFSQANAPPAASIASVTPTPTPSPLPAFTVLPTSTPAATPTALPSPSPTATLSPTPSPTLPPTFTPIPPPPAATNTPTPLPTATPCPNPIAPNLSALFTAGDLDELLGCPQAAAETATAAWQPFQSGQMLWRRDLRLIYVLRPDNSWRSYDDLWREGDLPFDSNIQAPDGLHQPVQGFGVVWRDETTGIRDLLGWGTAQEAGFEALIQRFGGGTVWFNPDENNYFILLNDGTYQIR
ncbi:MAG: serine/threonine-protein kinase [Chloroflexota bacterium]